jgi:hypothetical protein
MRIRSLKWHATTIVSTARDERSRDAAGAIAAELDVHLRP